MTRIISQLRTTDLQQSIEFFTTKLGCELDFCYQDFYAGIRYEDQVFHLKLVDTRDPNIGFVERNQHFHLYFEVDDVTAVADRFRTNEVFFVMDIHETPWKTREFAIRDDQGHILYFGSTG